MAKIFLPPEDEPIKRPLPHRREVPKVRRVINGLAYDTSTASVLYHHNTGDDIENMGWPIECGHILFLNAWGFYFTLQYDETGEPQNEIITPCTKEEAIAWAEKICPGWVEDIFGVMPEPGEGKPYQTKSPVE